MRILQLNSLLSGGGTDDQCVKLVFGLHQLGHNVWLAGPDGREFSRIVREVGVPFHAMPPGGLRRLRLIVAAAKLVRREQIQIVHGHHGRDFWPTVLAARLSGVRPKIVLTRHLAKSPGSWVSRHYLLGQCDAMIAVSHFVAKVLRAGVNDPESPEPERRVRPPMRGDPSKIHVLHGGIDTNLFRPMASTDGRVRLQRQEWGLAPEHFALAAVGGYDRPRGKGQREFLQAAARMHERQPHARFLIVGRGNLRDVLEADIRRLGLTGKAWLTPHCGDMPRGMNALDCLVHLQVGTEALGLVVCEAFACGKPVIASALDGIPEAFDLGRCGQLVPPEDIEEAARAMETWAGRGPLKEPERIDLHDRVQREFSVDALAARTIRLYRSLLEPGPTTA